MSAISILTIFCSLALASLVMISIVNQRERQSRYKRVRLNQLKRRADELSELVMELDQLVETRHIPKLINDEVINLYRRMLDEDPSARYLETSLRLSENRSQELSDEDPEREINRLKDSDSQINYAQHALSQAAQILQQAQSQGRITVDELELYVSDLRWARLQIEAISWIGQGHKAVGTSNIVNAYAFYNKALDTLLKNPHPDSRRLRMIEELNDILVGKRIALSIGLMHESHYNPTQPYNTPAQTEKDKENAAEEGSPKENEDGDGENNEDGDSSS